MFVASRNSGQSCITIILAPVTAPATAKDHPSWEIAMPGGPVHMQLSWVSQLYVGSLDAKHLDACTAVIRQIVSKS